MSTSISVHWHLHETSNIIRTGKHNRWVPWKYKVSIMLAVVGVFPYNCSQSFQLSPCTAYCNISVTALHIRNGSTNILSSFCLTENLGYLRNREIIIGILSKEISPIWDTETPWSHTSKARETCRVLVPVSSSMSNGRYPVKKLPALWVTYVPLFNLPLTILLPEGCLPTLKVPVRRLVLCINN